MSKNREEGMQYPKYVIGLMTYMAVADHETALEAEREKGEETERLLRNLLARIHRDGGQHTAAVGLEQSTNDADAAVCRMMVKDDGEKKGLAPIASVDGGGK